MYEVDLIGDFLVLIAVISGAFTLLSIIVRVLENRDELKTAPVSVPGPVRGAVRRGDRNRGALPHGAGRNRGRADRLASSREGVK